MIPAGWAVIQPVLVSLREKQIKMSLESAGSGIIPKYGQVQKKGYLRKT